MTDDTRELIERLRQAEDMYFEDGLGGLGTEAADALEASLPTIPEGIMDDRKALVLAVVSAQDDEGYPIEVLDSLDDPTLEAVADAILAAGFRRSPVPPEVDKPEPQPEDYCHRCGGKNISWATPSDVWNPIMRPDGPDSPWEWNEIICPLCFAELFEARFPNTSWEMRPDDLTRGAKAFRAEFPALAAVPPVTEETVTTVEELDALPVGTVVEDAFAATCIKTEGDRAVLGWHRVTSAVERGCHWHYPFVPARVLYRPDTEGDNRG